MSGTPEARCSSKTDTVCWCVHHTSHCVYVCKQVQLFDLRAPRGPLAVLKGHSKAVSYVRWAGPDALVSASTDSTLRLWTAAGGRGSSDSGGCGQQQQQQQPGTAAAAAGGGGGGGWDGAEEGGWHCSQVFRGHSNSKHFVGLATQGPFIACGSETNEVFMYHQGLAQPSLKCSLSPGADSSSHSGGGAAGAAGTEGAAAAAAAAAAAGGAGGAKSPFVSALCWKKGSDVLVAANSKGGVWVLSMQ
jgi:WD40 repeat protein